MIGFIVTIVSINKPDETYSHEKSMATFKWMYFLMVPVSLIFVVLVAYLLL
ncbi:hypothetical protein JCM19046_1485 [Bacillus sp. JCM 19046]|nr:hypothetical protein JCM19045_2540 [Bacillus sp. JCM 19045]GAF17013.1 hypothetical protein JCM19046_1485 [Bacillus sp. JCM 19046]